MNLEITGILASIKETEINTYQDKTYYKRKFIVTETGEQYPQSYLLEVGANLCDLLDNYKTGTLVTCKCNIRGKVYNDKVTGELKCFNTMQVWSIIAAVAQPPQQEYRPSAPDPNPSANEHTDLPF